MAFAITVMTLIAGLVAIMAWLLSGDDEWDDYLK